MREVLVACVLLALAGCIGPPPASQRESTPAFSPILEKWTFEDCYGFDAGTIYALESGPGEAPPGWEWSPLAAGRYLTNVGYEAFHCERASLLGLDRPLTMIFETHSRFSPPDNCTHGNYNHLAVVSNIFVDDSDLAAALSSVGLQSTFSTIESVRNEISHRWRWRFDNGTWSTLEILRGSGSKDVLPEVGRLAHWNGSELTMIDLTWSRSVPEVPGAVTMGELAPGTLYSGHEAKTFLGYGDVNLSAKATGRIVFQGDSSCDGFSR